ncbi:hypothetical protein SH2C18_36020 [Clostridium sediminicola]|uniref:helix-turn-helix domain-containing protein n=1 Tax=Clostridium sediminicola TaxID=3114879 RepID=UPI0031F227AC
MIEKVTNEIIQRIKDRRIYLGLSYQELADKTGLSKSTLQRYETGYIKKLSIEKLEILAKALDTTPSYLMGWEKNNPNTSLNGIAINNAEDAMKFILKEPLLMAYGGYDIKKMTNDELVDFANEVLRQLELISYKYYKHK